jgi:hypothetical protein
MWATLKGLVAGRPVEDKPEPAQPAPSFVLAEGCAPFDVGRSLTLRDGVARLDWNAVNGWIDALPESRRGAAWADCERAWLLHLRDALGTSYRLREQGQSLLLSSLDARTAELALSFMQRTQQRLLRLYNGVAEVPQWGHDILVVFDDQDSYYRYVAAAYAPDGEYAVSGGMHLNDGCSHFVMVKGELQTLEPVIAHEMTHGLLSHLPLPAWLNEGLAVNAELRLCPPPPPAPGLAETPWDKHERHVRFWTADNLQEFWSGRSFLRPDEGNELSYDLARILVEQLGKDWRAFSAFVCGAHASDAGTAAAQEHLGLRLGAAVAALLERPPDAALEPDPTQWSGEPERGAFA